MKLLIDSQSLIWYVDQDHLLSRTAHAAITDPNNFLLISAATIWEIGIKVGLNKLSLSMAYRQWMDKAIADLGLSVLPITVEYADVQAGYRSIIGTRSTGCWLPRPWSRKSPSSALMPSSISTA